MKVKYITIMTLAIALLTACKDKTYKPPTLDAMRSADKARAAWAREANGLSVIMEAQMNTNVTDPIPADSTSTAYSREKSNISYNNDISNSLDASEKKQSINETEE